MVAHEAIPENSADVVFIGSSHVYGAIIPQMLMDDYGIASVNAASGNQRLWHSVYELEWLLQRQKPRVVVVDLYTLGWLPRGLFSDHDTVYNESGYALAALVPRAIPWTNPLKYSALVREIAVDSQALPYLSTIGIRHDFIWDLSRSNFLNARGQSLISATFDQYNLLFDTYGKALDESITPNEHAVLSAFDRAQLLRMNELCNASGAELVLTGLPHLPKSQWLGLIEQVRGLAEEQGIAFLGMDTIISESSLDFAADMADSGHANLVGAQKLTDFFGQYLQDNYNLPDRREDLNPRYDVWKRRPHFYAAHAASQYLRYVKDFDEWVCEAENLSEDYLLIFATNNKHGAVMAEDINWDIITFLEMLGFEEAETFADEECGWFAIMEGTMLREEHVIDSDANYAAVINGHPLTLRASQGEDLMIKLDNAQINCGHEGLNIILYSKLECRVLVAACIDLTQEGIALRHNAQVSRDSDPRVDTPAE